MVPNINDLQHTSSIYSFGQNVHSGPHKILEAALSSGGGGDTRQLSLSRCSKIVLRPLPRQPGRSEPHQKGTTIHPVK